MAKTSIIFKSNLERRNRIDAEYYRPEYLHKQGILLKTNTRSLGQLSKSILSFGAYSLMNQVNYCETGIPFLRAVDLKEGYADFANVIYIDQDSHSLLWKSEVFPGLVLFAMSGSVGNAAVANPDWSYPVNSSQDLAKITPKDGVSAYYLSTFLNSRYGRFQTNRLPVGSIQQHIFLWQIKTIQIPIFPAIEDEISLLAKNAQSKVTLSKRLYAQAEHSLLTELGLLDWQPHHQLTFVRHSSEASQARRMDAEHFQLKYANLRKRIRSYPNGYCRITDIAYNSTETVEPRNHPEQPIKYIELANINQVTGTIESANVILGKEAPSRARMFLRSGDVIASSVKGSVDKVARVPEEYHGAIGSTGFFVLRPHTVESGYLLALVKSVIVREQMECEASGTILAAVPGKSLRHVIVPDIPERKRNEIAALVEQSHDARHEAQALLEKAKRGVEIAIEEGEEQAMAFLS